MERSDGQLKWGSVSKRINLTGENIALKSVVEALLLRVVSEFKDEFLGHAKCMVQAESETYFASTTGLPPIVEWKPQPEKRKTSTVMIEATYIYLQNDSVNGLGTVLDKVIEELEAEYQISAETRNH